MDYIEAREKLREAKREALANSCNIKVGRRELEVAIEALSKPDMRQKVKEYISELDAEIDRCHKLAEQNMNDGAHELAEIMMARVKTLNEVRNDLQSRLEELV